MVGMYCGGAESCDWSGAGARVLAVIGQVLGEGAGCDWSGAG
jgi:hypothetical protein